MTEEETAARAAVRSILWRGGVITLGTPEARRAWYDGIPALVGLVVQQFTPEEMAAIIDGAIPTADPDPEGRPPTAAIVHGILSLAPVSREFDREAESDNRENPFQFHPWGS